MVTLAPFGAKTWGLDENSNEYLQQLRKNLRSKHDIRLAKSVRPLAIRIGPFGRMDKCLCTHIVRYFTEYTGKYADYILNWF